MRLLLLLPLLAACAAPAPSAAPGGGARPRAVTLYRDTVTVAMSDGTFCTGVREAEAGPWSTRLAGCPHGWPVTVVRTTERPRLPLAPTAGNPWVALQPPAGPPLGFSPRGSAS